MVIGLISLDKISKNLGSYRSPLTARKIAFPSSPLQDLCGSLQVGCELFLVEVCCVLPVLLVLLPLLLVVSDLVPRTDSGSFFLSSALVVNLCWFSFDFGALPRVHLLCAEGAGIFVGSRS